MPAAPAGLLLPGHRKRLLLAAAQLSNKKLAHRKLAGTSAQRAATPQQVGPALLSPGTSLPLDAALQRAGESMFISTRLSHSHCGASLTQGDCLPVVKTTGDRRSKTAPLFTLKHPQ